MMQLSNEDLLNIKNGETRILGDMTATANVQEGESQFWDVDGHKAVDAEGGDFILDSELDDLISLYREKNDKTVAESINEISEQYDVNIETITIDLDYYFDFNVEVMKKSFIAYFEEAYSGTNEAVHESKNSEKVVKFLDETELSFEVLEHIYNGDVHGLYYNEDHEIVADIIGGGIIENVRR